MSNDERDPSLARVLTVVMDRRMEEVHTAMPGVVTRYDAALQQVDVQPAMGLAYEDEDGQRVYEDAPVIANVPVAFPQGGGYMLTFPLAAGDSVLLVFSQRSIDRWQTTGRVGDPGDDRRFHLSDAMAIPGISKAGALGSAADDHAMVGHTDSGVHMYSTGVSIGGVWADATAAARADRTESRLTALEGHKHYVPPTGGITSRPVTTTPEYDAQIGATTAAAPNPAHGAAGHVHYNTSPDPEPTVNSSAAAGGSAVAFTKLRGI